MEELGIFFLALDGSVGRHGIPSTDAQDEGIEPFALLFNGTV
jgi:hypothetical protein